MSYSEEESVKRGAALLDEKVPGWETKIQEAMFNGSFAMMHWDSCIAGTLELVQYMEEGRRGTLGGVGIALNGQIIVDEKEAAKYGFYPDPGRSFEWGQRWGERMKALWKEQVNQRVRTPLPTP